MEQYIVPQEINYIGVFLTFRCQYSCPYCINRHGAFLRQRDELSADEWIAGLSRLRTTADLPLSLQGGEPTLYTDLPRIVNHLVQPVDLLTNLYIGADYFIKHFDPERLRRESPYASIRVSYHSKQANFAILCSEVQRLLRKDYHIGIWEIEHPEDFRNVSIRQYVAKNKGIDYRLKEYLGEYNGKFYGTMRYPMAVGNSTLRTCRCRTSEILISPSGHLHRCHSDLYAGINPIGHILDEQLPDFRAWRACSRFGACNACDIKVTTDRFQQGGHSSVEISHAL